MSNTILDYQIGYPDKTHGTAERTPGCKGGPAITTAVARSLEHRRLSVDSSGLDRNEAMAESVVGCRGGSYGDNKTMLVGVSYWLIVANHVLDYMVYREEWMILVIYWLIMVNTV